MRRRAAHDGIHLNVLGDCPSLGIAPRSGREGQGHDIAVATGGRRLAATGGRRLADVIDERKAPPAAVVIFGASGDLTVRKLGPAVENPARHKRIPAEFGVVGVARTQMDRSSGPGWPVRKAR